MAPDILTYHSNSIKHWPEAEKPRERLLQNGAEALSDAELLAILLRTGIRGQSAVGLARDLLSRYGGLRGILSLDAPGLRAQKGLGPAKIAAILAATEIARRQLRQDLIGKHYISDPQSVMVYLYATLRDKTREVFKVLFLNKSHRIVGEADLSEGTVDEAAVHPREVVKAALDRHATAIIVVHNHPSGRTDPSPQDRKLTSRLRDACETVSIKLLDHIIIGDNHYFSFAESGL